MGFNEIMQMFAHIYLFILQINVAQKMGSKVVPEWTSFPQGRISLKKNQCLKRWGPK
jgi:hypothetical protein